MTTTDTPPDLIGDYLARRGRRGGGTMTKAYARRLAEQRAARPQAKKPRATAHRASDPRRLPIGPFRAWMQDTCDERGIRWVETLVMRATDCAFDVAQRKVYRWLHESNNVHIDTVDTVTLHADGPDLLRELYPLDDGPSPVSAPERGSDA